MENMIKNTLQIATFFILLHSGYLLGYQHGCAAPPLLPNLPFFVVWNHPTAACEARGIPLHLERWGIVDNTHDSFIGSQIALLYGPGSFPYFSGNVTHNGGIPQLSNLTFHLQKLQNDLAKNVKSSTFDGLGIIDFEAWRPLYSLNFDRLRIYKDKSLALAREKFPTYNRTQLVQEATREFETAARKFLESTLQMVSILRSSGKWGYYGYPRCWDKYCNTSSVAINNRMSWIYQESSGLYPSIYFYRSLANESRARLVNNVVREALRVKASWSAQDIPILPYAWTQDTAYDMYNESDLSFSIGQPADMGASGVILWGSSNLMHAKNECSILQAYVNNTLGPYVLRLSKFFTACSKQLCHNHGRCVRKDYEKYYQHYLQGNKYQGYNNNCRINRELLSLARNQGASATSNKQVFKFKINLKLYEVENLQNTPAARIRADTFYEFDNYVCKCYKGWSGIYCDMYG